MSVTKRVGLLAGAATFSLTGASFADNTADQTIADLQKEVAELRQAVHGDSWMTEQRTAQIKGLVQDVLADADTRASLLQGGPMAGHDGHFFLASPDGNYRLNVGGLLQVGFVWNNSDNGGSFGDEDRWSFENKRTKLYFWGHVVNPDWMYKIEGGFGRDSRGSSSAFNGTYADYSEGIDFDGFEGDFEDFLDEFGSSLFSSSSSSDYSFELLDAWIAHNCGNGLTAYVGQFKAPFLHEELVADEYSLAYDRSGVSEFFTSERVQGIMLHYRQDVWEVMGSYDDGIRSRNTAWSAYDTEFSFHARANWLIAGTWEQTTQHTSPRGQEFGARLGGAIRYSIQEFGTAGPLPAGEQELFSWTVDASVHFGGASLMGAIVGNHVDFETAALADMDQWGFILQGGFYLNDEWEIFARYEWADADIAGVEDLSLLTFGVNYYFAGQQVKWTADVVIGLEEVESYFTNRFANGTITGIAPDFGGSDGQVAIRTQLQLMF